MTTKHTPGPWTAGSGYDGRGNSMIYADDYDVVAYVPPPTSNARLIAAAPELLQIAKAYRNLLKTMAHTEGEVATYHHIEAVITKATGGTR